MVRQALSIFKQFRQQWARDLLLVLACGLVPLMIVMPLLRLLIGALLRVGDVPFLAPSNVLTVLRTKPLVSVALLLVFCGVAVLACMQLLFLAVAIRTLQTQPLLTAVRAGWQDLRHFRLSSVPLLTAFGLLLLPLTGLILNGSWLAKFRLPLFLAWWLSLRPVLAVSVLALYLLSYWLGIRWLSTLRNLDQSDGTVAALAKSRRQTRGHFWSLTRTLAVLLAVIAACSYGWTALVTGVQALADDSSWAFTSAVGLAAVLLFGKLLIAAAACVLGLLWLGAPLDGRRVSAALKQRRSAWSLLLLSAVMTVVPLTMALVTYQFNPHPLTIAHRGVDGNNGVQNTLPALRRTAAHHPDYVEMDVHETKDKQFVVLHDENLRKLAGVSKTPRQLTLRQLQAITVREHGHQAKLASFDDYLRAADHLHQRLIVELKTTRQDSPDMVTRFAQRYGRGLRRRGDRVHSLNDAALTTVRRQVPGLYTSYVLGGSLTFPKTQLDAYSMGTPMLDTVFTAQAHARKQAVWAWTVNMRASMVQMMFAGSDGIVTDNLSTLQAVSRQQRRHPAYVQWLRLISDSGDDLWLGGLVE
jgi:glycerophosphoryl diester phosphodiesterase